MRGDQLAPQWRVTRAIEASLDGLTMAEIAAKSLFQKLEWAFSLWGPKPVVFPIVFLNARAC